MPPTKRQHETANIPAVDMPFAVYGIALHGNQPPAAFEINACIFLQGLLAVVYTAFSLRPCPCPWAPARVLMRAIYPSNTNSTLWAAAVFHH